MGKSVDAPDYGPMAQASEKAAKLGARLGNRQLRFAREQYNELKPLIHGIAEQQRSAQDQQMRQAEDYYDYMRNTYRPLERSLVKDAETFNTENYREGLAQQAAADSGRAISTAQESNRRAMASMGINPNSGRFASMQNQTALGLGAQRASAMNNTRQQAQQLGWAKKMDATGLGRGLSGASSGAYAGAIAAGNSASSNYMAPGNQYMQGLNQGAGTVMQGQAMNLQGQGAILNSQTQMAGLKAQQQAGALQGVGTGMGMYYALK